MGPPVWAAGVFAQFLPPFLALFMIVGAGPFVQLCFRCLQLSLTAVWRAKAAPPLVGPSSVSAGSLSGLRQSSGTSFGRRSTGSKSQGGGGRLVQLVS